GKAQAGQWNWDQKDTTSQVTLLIYDQECAPALTSIDVTQTGTWRSGRDDKASLQSCTGQLGPATDPIINMEPSTAIYGDRAGSSTEALEL
ncbi:hypothetical protein KUCAC02_025313, partial [Chaenocephalus aceratus]